MTMAAFGELKHFEPEVEKISSYLERVDLYFTANQIADERKVAVFLSVIGAKTYSLLRDLVSPASPKDKSLEHLADVLKKHFEPKPLIIAERFTFYRRNQSTSELILEYVAELRRLTTHRDQALRDRLVCGLRSETIQKRRLSEAHLTLARAVEISQGMEAAHQNTQLMKGKVEGVIIKVTQEQNPTNSVDKQEQYKKKKHSFRCGKPGHSVADCTFKDSYCHKCGKKGHIAKVCRTKRTGHTQWVETDESNDVIFRVGNRSQPYQVMMQLDGKGVIMEVDTGAAVSVMSSKSLKSLFPRATLQKTTVRLRIYMAKEMPVPGKMSIDVRYVVIVESTHCMW